MRAVSLHARSSLLLAATLLPLVTQAESPESDNPSAPVESEAGHGLSEPAPQLASDDNERTHAREVFDEERPTHRGRTKLDVGFAAGFNSPSGIVGGELEFRAIPQLGLNLGAGIGAWGTRISPSLRLYPLGEVGASPFFEAGASFNLGTEAYSEEHPGNRNYAELLMTPAAIGSFGLRAALGTKVYLTSRVGWAWRLREDNYRMRDGSRPDAFTEDVIDLLQHGGFLTSLTLGFAFY
ncbi:hypothetical protein JGU66_07795 [Myxococcaceae bacterium JPH2]|nr:hypothetical protein [Myxococcaceae bacterium JPH2]